MFSTEESLDPSSSSQNQTETKSDERNSALEKIGSQKLDAIDFVASPPTPNFSIRDYTYNSRNNGIGACWPFKPKFLQLCLKNGVKELLPPFEPPHLIKNHLISSAPQPDLSASDVLLERRELDSNKTIDSAAENLQSVVIKEKKKKFKGVKKVKNSSELPEKKCKLVVKLSSSVPGTNRAEELVSSNSAVLDQMASKICPVCKTFSSSSNTTLNAHIDQCLSMGSNTKQFELDVLKPKVKPRKKKSMVEIYATALHYTLEDLDKRNGTNFAASAVAAEPSKMQAELINRKLKELENPRARIVESKGIDREGAVYVDSNGIKIRILSKFSNVPALTSVVSREDKKEMVKFGKRKGVASKNMKRKKLKLERKKFKKFKILKSQVQQSTTDGDGSGTGNDNQNEEADLHLDHLSEIPKGPAILPRTASPLGNWVCAKRSDIHKKRKNKNPYKITQSLASIIDDSPSTSSQIHKYSNSKLSTSTLRRKLPRPLVQNGGNSNRALSENVSTNASFDKNPSAQPQNTPSLSGTFRKQRSMLKFGKRGRQNPSSSRIFQESTEVVPAGETIRENRRLKFTHNAEHREQFAPELDRIIENTEILDGTSLPEGIQFEIEAADSKDHFPEYVDTPNDEPINLEIASWYQEEVVVARAGGYEDSNNDAHGDDEGDEGSDDDDDISDGVDVDVEDDDDDDAAIGTPDYTSHDTPQDDSSITSNREDEMNLERSLANFRELSGSPSTASTMSLSTLNEPVSKPLVSFAQPLDSDLPVQVADRPKGIEERMEKSCVCSCRESLPESNPLRIAKERQLPPLYIGPRETGPFSAYRSFTQPDPLVSSGFELPSQSLSTLPQNPVPPSPSNPILRLMGKNLLVVNHEEITAPPTPSSHSPSGFGLPDYSVNQNCSYQKFSSVVSPSQPSTNLYQAFHVSDSQRMVSPPYVPKEMIVMDGSPKINNIPVPLSVPVQLQSVSMVGPENSAPQNISMLGPSMMQPRPFFCFPPQNQVGSTGTILYPRVGAGYITQQVAPPGSHEPGSFVPGSFMFQSPSNQVSNVLYYSHSMR
ncbi:hapless protein [Rhynchospora pubera]|uniref:Hapless protein n=1 Tax=Rhynchospora pubera TaxID=906938 RepID=A0AAV8BWI2_9POAL|nr:hapless protein [Rhynchospora pubera]